MEEKYWFSVTDVIQVLTDQPTACGANTYWAVLKKRLREEGANELLTKCKQLKLQATDGKMRKTDVADTEQLLRIIQSIPSKKAEPLKQWIARVAREQLETSLGRGVITSKCASDYLPPKDDNEKNGNNALTE